MKNNRTLAIATPLITLSTAFSIHSMERTKPDTTLKIYTAKTIRNIKKERHKFRKDLAHSI